MPKVASSKFGSIGQRLEKWLSTLGTIESGYGIAQRNIRLCLLRVCVIGEVKNVGSLSYTRQIRDFVAYAKQNGLRFELTVRQSTKLSRPPPWQ
jgi:hypothetical protein